MTCPHCDSTVAEGVQYCPACGADISAIEENEGKTPKKAAKKPSSARKKLNGIIAVVAVILLAALIIFIAVKVSSDVGERIAMDLSDKIGRSIALAEKNANVTLSETSAYPILKQVERFNYIFESDKSVKVEGIHLPEWAVYVQTDNNDRITTVTYYNYKVLESNWKGQKAPQKIDSTVVEYGMSVREAEKAVPLKPLSITRSYDDITHYRYKYYYVDEESKNELAYYLDIAFNVDNKVTSISNTENDYMPFVLK